VRSSGVQSLTMGARRAYMPTSATEGLLPRRVERVERWVFKEERRSAVFAGSSVAVAMWEEVMSHCSISAFSGWVYCDDCQLCPWFCHIYRTYLDVRIGAGRELVRVVASVLGLRVWVVNQGLDLVVDMDGSHGSNADLRV
jgi:hypothetical protein